MNTPRCLATVLAFARRSASAQSGAPTSVKSSVEAMRDVRSRPRFEEAEAGRGLGKADFSSS